MKNLIKYILASAIAIAMFPSIGKSQLFDRLKNAVKNKVEDRVQRKVEETVDQGADEVENSVKKKKEKEKKESKKNQAEKEKTDDPILTKKTDKNDIIGHDSKFDFKPGNIVLYREDFSQDALDQFPLKWATDHKGMIVNRPGKKEKWMRMMHSSQFMSPVLSRSLPDNFTVEFDIIMDLKYDGYFFPTFKFRLIENLTGDQDGRKYMNDANANSIIPGIDLTLSPGNDDNSEIAFQSTIKGAQHFQNEGNRLSRLSTKYGKVVSVSLWVQKQRMRLWIDEDKVYDVPQAIPSPLNLNRIALQISSSIQPESEIGYYISNIRIAAAGADTRTKLINEGRFSTNAILFNTNSDKIKPESNAILQELAAILKENPTVHIRIIGHTDSEGNDDTNMKLSKQRAIAVKQALANDFSIESERIETDGMGETQPVADNTTEAGRSQNRRVEFLKL